jgi:16S rRNA (uracil1498-N3)-methyltransferase
MDGQGGVYTATIVEVGRNVIARMICRREESKDGVVQLWVGQGLLKGKKMDGTIQQCTELGVTRLIPFFSSRCQGSPRELRERQKAERWDRIVISACKQCKRSDLMAVEELVEYPTMLSQFGNVPGLLRLLFWEEETDFRLRPEMIGKGSFDKILILLGPEGGFSRDEVVAARKVGWQTVSLGRRILRAETATLTAVSLVQYLVGNM